MWMFPVGDDEPRERKSISPESAKFKALLSEQSDDPILAEAISKIPQLREIAVSLRSVSLLLIRDGKQDSRLAHLIDRLLCDSSGSHSLFIVAHP